MVYICKGRVSGFVRIEGAQAKARCKEVDHFLSRFANYLFEIFFSETTPQTLYYYILYLLTGVWMCSGVFRNVFAMLFGERAHCQFYGYVVDPIPSTDLFY